MGTTVDGVNQGSHPKGHGGLTIHGASGTQVIATGAAQKVTLWEAATPEVGGCDGQLANNRVVVGQAGEYLVSWHMGYSASGGSLWTGHIYLDGVDSGIGWHRNIVNANRPGSISCGAPLTIPVGGVIEAYIEHNQGGDVTLTIQESQLYVSRVG